MDTRDNRIFGIILELAHTPNQRRGIVVRGHVPLGVDKYDVSLYRVTDHACFQIIGNDSRHAAV